MGARRDYQEQVREAERAKLRAKLAIHDRRWAAHKQALTPSLVAHVGSKGYGPDDIDVEEARWDFSPRVRERKAKRKS